MSGDAEIDLTDQGFAAVEWWVEATGNVFGALCKAGKAERYDVDAITREVYRWDAGRALFVPRPMSVAEFWALVEQHYA